MRTTLTLDPDGASDGAPYRTPADSLGGCRLPSLDDVAEALAMEYGLVLQSTDRDFSRFPGLRWDNPLEG